MDIILLVLHVVLSLGIITLVLLQKGAGASAGASFGGGAGSVFGATGSSNFLSKTTAVFATAFFVNSLVLAYLASHRDMNTDSVLDAVPAIEVPAAVDPLDDIPAPDALPGADTAVEDAVEDDIPPPAGEQ